MYFLYALFGGLFFLISLQDSWSEGLILLPIAIISLPLTKWGMRWQNERYVRSAQNQDDLKIVMNKLDLKYTHVCPNLMTCYFYKKCIYFSRSGESLFFSE